MNTDNLHRPEKITICNRRLILIVQRQNMTFKHFNFKNMQHEMKTISVDSREYVKPLRPNTQRPWYKRKLFLLIAAAIVLVIVLAIGLGVGLTRSGRSQGSDDSSNPSVTPLPNGTVPSTVWQPKAGTSWDIQLSAPLDPSNATNFAAWDFDLFDNSKETIATMQSRGTKVICYFSAGTKEDWRPDAGNFTKSDLGSPMGDWPGETWLNVSSPNVRQIMLRRLDLAVQKGCDAVDPDNMDGYGNQNGLNLTMQDTINYVSFLADAAHKRNLAIGLKNAGEVIPSVIGIVQFSVNEQCAGEGDCDLFAPMIQVGKPVFNIEYPKGTKTNNNINVSADLKKKVCHAKSQDGFSTVIKNHNLDSWTQLC